MPLDLELDRNEQVTVPFCSELCPEKFVVGIWVTLIPFLLLGMFGYSLLFIINNKIIHILKYHKYTL